MRSLLFFVFLSQICLLNAQSKVYIRFPDDLFIVGCEDDSFGEPVVYNPDSIPILVNYIDAPCVMTVPVNCFYVEREWQITLLNNWDPNKPFKLVYIPNPNPSPKMEDPANLEGAVLSDICERGNVWSASLVKAPAGGQDINFCSFYDDKALMYTYIQKIRWNDYEAPAVFDCPVTSLQSRDSTDNAPEFWNEKFWPNNGAGLEEAPVTLSISGLDACPINNYISASYRLHLDLDGDGIQESVTASNVGNKGSINFGNLLSSNIGVKREFDSRPVPEAQKYYFGISSKKLPKGGQQFTACWVSHQQPNTSVYIPMQLPPGKHQITWWLSDQCGNETPCSVDFIVNSRPLSSPEANTPFDLSGAAPNPFSEETRIGFHTNEADEITLQIFDGLGTLVHTQQSHFQTGENGFDLNNSAFAHEGIFIYLLKNSKGQQQSGKLAFWKK